MYLEHCPFGLVSEMRVLDVKSDLLVDTLLDVSEDGLLDKIERIVIHFDSGHTQYRVMGLLPARMFRLVFGM